MKNEQFIFDVITVFTGSMVPDSSEYGVKSVLESYAGRHLERREWVEMANELREHLRTQYPDLNGVFLPRFDEGAIVSEWRRAIFLHFGFFIDIPKREQEKRGQAC